MNPVLALRLATLRALSAYVRHVPEHKGQWRIAQFTAARSPLLRELCTAIPVRLKDGSRLLVDGTSQTGPIAFTTGRYEPRATELIRRRVRTGDTVVDVGANIGYFAVVAARAVGPTGRVLAFEPMPSVRRALEDNLRLNEIDSVVVRAEALGPRAGEVTFYAGPATDTGLGSLREMDGASPFTVRQCRFDDLGDSSRRVALVKIDVEGGELGVLEGMDGFLSRDQPELILEVTDAFLRSMGASAEQLFGFLVGRGYRIWMITEQGALPEIASVRHLSQCPPQFNVFCSARSAPN